MRQRLGIATTLKNLRHYSATELIASGVDVIAGCPTSLLHIWSLLQDACLPIRYPAVAQALSADLPAPRRWDETTGWHGDDVAASSLTCCDDARRYADPA